MWPSMRLTLRILKFENTKTWSEIATSWTLGTKYFLTKNVCRIYSIVSRTKWC